MAITISIADAGKLFPKEEKSTTDMKKYYFIVHISIIIIILAILVCPLFPHSKTSLFIKFGKIYFLFKNSVQIERRRDVEVGMKTKFFSKEN